jgi:hypothetical protein
MGGNHKLNGAHAIHPERRFGIELFFRFKIPPHAPLQVFGLAYIYDCAGPAPLPHDINARRMGKGFDFG